MESVWNESATLNGSNADITIPFPEQNLVTLLLNMTSTSRENTTLIEETSLNYTNPAEASFSQFTLPEWCLPYHFVLQGLVMALICTCGIVGNTLTKITLGPEFSKNSTSFLLIVLAGVDSLTLLTQLLAGIRSLLVYYEGAAVLRRNVFALLIVFGWSFISLGQGLAAWTIVLISFCRYIALCRPHDVKKYTSIRKVQVITGITFVLVTSFFLPDFLANELVYDDVIQRYDFEVRKFATNLAYTIYDVPIYYTLMYIIPSTLIVTMTIIQVVKLREISKKREELSKSSKEQNDITISLIFMVVFFLVLHLGEPIRLIVFEIEGVKNATFCHGMSFHASVLKMLFAALNSSINFFIYFVGAKKFRRQLKRRLGSNKSIYPTVSVTVG